MLQPDFLNLPTRPDRIVPLFWTQTGYGLKPPPVLATDRTHDQNLDALKRHFMRTIPAYGHHVRWYLPFDTDCLNRDLL